MKNKIKTKSVYRIDALDELYIDDIDSKKYKFSEAVYNEAGNLLLESEYDADANLIYQQKMIYNENGLLQQFFRSYYGEQTEEGILSYNIDDLLAIEKTIYAGSGEKHTNYTYNESKKLVTKTTEDHSQEDPAVEEKFDYKDQQLIKHSIYHDKKNQPHYWHTINYDEIIEGKITEETIFDEGTGITTLIKNGTSLSYRDNKLISRITRTFDEKQQLTEELTEDVNGKRIYRYGYDDKANMIVEERHLKGAIYFKVLSQYNDAGLLQQQTVIDPENGSYTEFYDYIFYD